MEQYCIYKAQQHFTSHFTQKRAGHWKGVPREAVTRRSLEVFKKCLDNALRHMMCFLGYPAQDLNFDDLYGSLQDILWFCDSMTSQGSGKQGLKSHLCTLNHTSPKVFSWSACECMKMSYIGILVFCL